MVSDVMSHVWRRVPASARADAGQEQQPDYQVSGNFPVALLLGGKGLSKGVTPPDPLQPLPASGPGVSQTMNGAGVQVGRDQEVRGDLVRGEQDRPAGQYRRRRVCRGGCRHPGRRFRRPGPDRHARPGRDRRQRGQHRGRGGVRGGRQYGDHGQGGRGCAGGPPGDQDGRRAGGVPGAVGADQPATRRAGGFCRPRRGGRRAGQTLPSWPSAPRRPAGASRGRWKTSARSWRAAPARPRLRLHWGRWWTRAMQMAQALWR